MNSPSRPLIGSPPTGRLMDGMTFQEGIDPEEHIDHQGLRSPNQNVRPSYRKPQGSSSGALASKILLGLKYHGNRLGKNWIIKDNYDIINQQIID
jgi:hypothetical protein